MLAGRSSFFVREHVGMFKLAGAYDILDPATKEQIAIAKEEPGPLILLLRMFMEKRQLPTKVVVYEGAAEGGRILFSIKKAFTLFRSRVDVLDGDGNRAGWFKSKMISLGGAFRVFDAEDREVAVVKGDWKGWNFKFTVGDEEIGTVTRKWSGMGKELFTSADNYIISLSGEISESKAVLLLAAGLAVDIVYKEK